MSDHPRKRVSQETLNQEFDNNDWEKRLQSYTKVEYYNRLTPESAGLPKGTSTIGYEYMDAENKRVALVFHCETPDREIVGNRRFRPKELLVGGESWFV